MRFQFTATMLVLLILPSGAVCRKAGVADTAEQSDQRSEVERAMKSGKSDSPSLERAVFAGGCFWCVEAVFEELEGVSEAISGYAGGTADTANYEAVCTGRTGHAETVAIIYDPKKISYEKLLSVHFATHDPTTKNRQGADVGPQYRSAIFYENAAEKRTAEAAIARLNKSDAFGGKPIVTTIEPLKKFYKAESYHQNYVCDNPMNPYVANVAMPKVGKVREKFKNDLKKQGTGRADGPTVEVFVYNKSGKLSGPLERPKVIRSDEEWKRLLKDEQYRILRKAGTEAAFCGTLLDNKKEGVYTCAGCSLPLFSSDAKFKSGTGWPSFYQPIGGKHNVGQRTDRSHGMVRTEIICNRCDGHLGHVFDDGPRPAGLRYCLNSESLRFVEKGRIREQLAESDADD